MNRFLSAILPAWLLERIAMRKANRALARQFREDPELEARLLKAAQKGVVGLISSARIIETKADEVPKMYSLVLPPAWYDNDEIREYAIRAYPNARVSRSRKLPV